MMGVSVKFRKVIMVALTKKLEERKKMTRCFASEFLSLWSDRMENEGLIFPEVLEKLWEQGYLTLVIPEKFGGCGAGILESLVVVEELSRKSSSIGLLVSIQAIGTLIFLKEKDEQKKEKLLQTILNERKLVALAISEPEDFLSSGPSETVAIKRNEGYEINGQKTLVNFGSEADWVIVFALSSAEQGLKKGLSAFLMERGQKGFLIAGETKRMGFKALPWAELRLEKVKVAEDAQIGGEGDAYEIIKDVLSSSAPVIGAISLGLLEESFEIVTSILRKRKDALALWERLTMGRELAEIQILMEASRALLYSVADGFDRNGSAEFALHSKIFSNENAIKGIGTLIELLGTYGLSAHYPLERYLREAEVLRGTLGSNYFQRLTIARRLL